ncbi:MAG TPA: FmdB family zinc ribbon protein [Burkholderiaceae bacterium]|nr:FmdB family zinc ribbon protein [Burkholderiaceae bacterium]
MPIYAYRCAACGHAKDVLQKISDPPLADCPACGAPRFEKQVTAAGFQLKGSGWYATDFRNGSTPKPDAKTQPQTEAKTDAKTASDTTSAPAAATPAPATAPPPAGPSSS